MLPFPVPLSIISHDKTNERIALVARFSSSYCQTYTYGWKHLKMNSMDQNFMCADGKS